MSLQNIAILLYQISKIQNIQYTGISTYDKAEYYDPAISTSVPAEYHDIANVIIVTAERHSNVVPNSNTAQHQNTVT